MKKAYIVSLVAMLALVVVAIGLAGCDNTSDNSLVVTPQAVTLNTTNSSENAQVFVASLPMTSFSDTNSTMFFPLEWSVSDTSLGNIAGHGGDSAVYTRTTGRGSNVITVRDAGGREGIAEVTQY